VFEIRADAVRVHDHVIEIAMSRIAVVVGTRPQIIKSAPIITKLSDRRGVQLSLIHTGQHYDYELSKVFFNEMSLPDPTLNLGVRANSHAQQTSQIMVRLERTLLMLNPKVVLVPGDTNSALATSLVAVKLNLPCAHLEAGPRQFDLSIPEEANRVVVDHLSKMAFAPTRLSLMNLRREGLGKDRAWFVGDTMLDCLIEHVSSSRKIDISNLGVESGFVLTTIHRQENSDVEARLEGIVRALVSAKQFIFLFPVHPRTRKNLRRFGLWKKLTEAENVHVTDPVDYETSLAMIKGAQVVLTDSGGVQKEAFWLGTPCITVSKSTPWPETLRRGANRCVKPNSHAIVAALSQASMLKCDDRHSRRLFGDGHASEKVCEALLDHATTH
jgi:UDP-N-acetylglucosamine 2-epimerase